MSDGLRAFHNRDLLRRQAAARIDAPVNLSFEGAGIILQNLDSILRNNGVIGNQRQAFDIRLRDDDPIERVFS